MKELFIISILGFFCVTLSAQSDTEINQYFTFQDGIYLSYDALLKNQPEIKLEGNRSGIFNNPLQILRVDPSEFGLSADQEIKFVVDQGLPYHRSARCCPDHVVYVGMTIVGHLSVISYDSEIMVDIPMKAYNPFNGEPFLKGTIKREKTVKMNQVLDLTTGTLYDMSDTAVQSKLKSTKPYQFVDVLIDDVVKFNKANKIFVQ